MLPHLIWEQSATYTPAAICIHTCRVFWEKAFGTFAFANCVKSRKGVWGRIRLVLLARPPLDAIWISHSTWPGGRSRRSGLGGSEQMLRREVKLDGMRCIRAKRRTHSWFRRTCLKTGILYGWAQLPWKVRARRSCLLNRPEERHRTVTSPGRRGCIRGQYHRQDFSIPHRHSRSSSSHWSKRFL